MFISSHFSGSLLRDTTDVKPLQLRKAYSPMLVTLLGIVIEVRPLQPSPRLMDFDWVHTDLFKISYFLIFFGTILYTHRQKEG